MSAATSRAPGDDERPSRELAVVAGAAAFLPPTTLDTLVAAASLQTRVDRKYLISADVCARLSALLSGQLHALDIGGLRQFRYESVYFDSPDLLLYRQHLQGRRRRYKVRTRSYLDSGDCMFEVKLRGPRNQTIKARMAYRIEDRNTLTSEAKAFLADLLQAEYRTAPPTLQPITSVSYTRTTLVDFAEGTRPTLDVDVSCSGAGQTVHGRGHVLVETKTMARDSEIDRILRQLGARPVRMSKYSLAVAALYPMVPANPLHRTLRRYFGVVL